MDVRKTVISAGRRSRWTMNHILFFFGTQRLNQPGYSVERDAFARLAAEHPEAALIALAKEKLGASGSKETQGGARRGKGKSYAIKGTIPALIS